MLSRLQFRYEFLVEGEKANLALINDHFSPTSGLFSILGYLGVKFFRFRGLIYRIVAFSSSTIIELMAEKRKIGNFAKMRFCKKWLRVKNQRR